MDRLRLREAGGYTSPVAPKRARKSRSAVLKRLLVEGVIRVLVIPGRQVRIEPACSACSVRPAEAPPGWSP